MGSRFNPHRKKLFLLNLSLQAFKTKKYAHIGLKKYFKRFPKLLGSIKT